jgi:DNA-binding NtrC family response regulator
MTAAPPPARRRRFEAPRARIALSPTATMPAPSSTISPTPPDSPDAGPDSPAASSSHLLLVEDDATYRDRLARNLGSAGFGVQTAPDGRAALELLRREWFDLIVSDIRMPGLDGAGLVDRIRGGREANVDTDTPIVFLTSVSDLRTGVEMMRRGAADFITKDSDLGEVVLRLRRALERNRLVNENRLLKDQLERRARDEFGEIIGRSRAIVALREEIALVGSTGAPVLVMGETGSGKQLVARGLHAAHGGGRGPFVDVNCAALPDENLFHSEVFGHEVGAFTGATTQRRGRFEQAHGGTLFLDEVGELSHSAQAKLLKVIETQEFTRLGGSKPISVKSRLIFATNRDLKTEVAAGRFREDLYYRINVVPLAIPPLRDRPEDVPMLAAFFAEGFAARYGRPRPMMEPGAVEALSGYAWPGNIRELRNIMERLVIRQRGDTIGAADLAAVGLTAVPRRETEGLIRFPEEGVDLEGVERSLVEAALERADWNQKEAARLLNISHDRMNARVKKFGIRHSSWRRNR